MDPIPKRSLFGLLILLGALFIFSSAEAQTPKVNTLDLTTAIADVARRRCRPWSISR